ncbi:hypothetical protein CLF_109320 [Clonorchis sinensis]|uniref:Uncharacterized protein n=1 Tax=Clonorchis sinensis TaxID=79923 RepID=G7YSG9_CLOSI|nr:hypothetical protein CLF_109320 [Clonorchis sinensis]
MVSGMDLYTGLVQLSFDMYGQVVMTQSTASACTWVSAHDLLLRLLAGRDSQYQMSHPCVSQFLDTFPVDGYLEVIRRQSQNDALAGYSTDTIGSYDLNALMAINAEKTKFRIYLINKRYEIMGRGQIQLAGKRSQQRAYVVWQCQAHIDFHPASNFSVQTTRWAAQPHLRHIYQALSPVRKLSTVLHQIVDARNTEPALCRSLEDHTNSRHRGPKHFQRVQSDTLVSTRSLRFTNAANCVFQQAWTM